MPTTTNKRLWYAVQQVQIAPNGTSVTGYTSAHAVHGLQTAGQNLSFNLDSVFELGQSEVYEQIENLPNIEITLEKVLDNWPLLWHLATPTASAATLISRGSNQQCQVLTTIFDDTRDSASGAPQIEVESTGLFVSQLSYKFPVEGNATESLTLVGDHRVWRASPSGSGYFTTNTDSPSGIGVIRRQDISFGSGSSYSILPPKIHGIFDAGGGSGYNISTNGVYGASFQSINLSANFNRENMFELGRRKPYHRYAGFPVEVRSEFEIMSKNGDYVNADPETDNTSNEVIHIKLVNNMRIDCGNKNRLETVTVNGGGASDRGGNQTITYSYVGYNKMAVYHSGDPAGVANP